jgi:two-component system, sensor histidine kinase and response regulator
MQNLQKLPVQQEAMLKQLDALRVHLAFSLPHELRTPLNTILGFSRFLVTHGPAQWPDTEKMLDIQSAIYNSALRLQRLIENYILYTNLRLMEDDLEKKPQEAWQRHDVLETAALIAPVALFAAKAENRQDDLTLTLLEADIRFSRKSLQKILEELLNNALKFSRPGSPLRIITSMRGQHWRLSVIDRGCGMTAEQISALGAFIQFERPQHRRQGSGLGLAIASLLAQMNDTELHIESVPGRGTSVTLEVPIHFP